MKPRRNHVCTAVCAVLLLAAARGVPAQETPPALEGRVIGQVVLMGNSRTKDWVVLRELGSKPGAALDYGTLLEDEWRLTSLGVFSEVRIWPLSVRDGVRLYVEVREQMPWVFLPILYRSHREGWTYGVGGSLTNLRGRAERLQIQATLGGLRGVRASWYTPWVWRRIFLRLLAEHVRTEDRYNDFHPTMSAVDLTVGRPLGRWWKASVEARWAVLDSDRDGKTVSADNRDVLPRLGVKLVYDSRDAYDNPHRGWLGSAGVWRTGGRLGGTVDFAEAAADLRRYQPLWLGHTLAVGAQTTFREGTVPLYKRIHLGGSETVRGWASRSFQGDNSLIAGVEYRFDLARRRVPFGPGGQLVDQGFGGAFFADTGAVWEQGESPTDAGLHSGFGLGLRIFAPFVEVVRLDYAWNTRGDGRWEIGLYPKF